MKTSSTCHLSPGLAPALLVGVELPELPTPAPDRFASDHNTTRKHQLLDLTKAQWEPVIQPHAVGDDLAAARRWADDVVSATTAWSLAAALTSRALVEIAQGELDAAERDARQALDIAASLGGDLLVPFAIDCLAIVAGGTGNNVIATRLFASAEAARTRMGMAQFKVLEAGDQATIAAVRDALSANNFDSAWAEGTALSMEEAIAYAQRGRGQRNAPTAGGTR